MRKNLCLVDGSGFIFRAYYAMPPLSKADGTPIGAVFGFTSMLMNLLEKYKDSYLVVIFDAARRNFRHDIYPEYKANRGEAPEDLVPQFPIMREVCEAFHVPCIEQIGVEADDIIATYAVQAKAKGIHTTIISADKDLMQLLDNENVFLYDPMKNKNITLADVEAKFGVAPDKVIDVQALIGDSSDNVPGVPGIGPKTASELIRTYETLEALLNNIHTIKQNKRRESLMENKELALISKQLVTLKKDVKVPLPIEELIPKSIQFSKITEFLETHGFNKLKPRARGLFGEASDENSLVKREENFKYICIQNESQLKELIPFIYELGYLAIDTETTGLNTMQDELVGISLAYNTQKAYYIPLNHCAAENQKISDQLDIETVQQYLLPIFQDRAILKIGHNIKFDLKILRRYGLNVSTYEDTMCMSYTLDMGAHSHGLDDLCMRYFQHENIAFKDVIQHAPKDGRKDGNFSGVPLEYATPYAAEDALMTLRLFFILRQRLEKEKLLSIYSRIDRPLLKVLMQMEIDGVKVDTNYLMELSKKFRNQTAELEQEIYKEAGQEFTIASPKQLSELLFEHLNLTPVGKKNKMGIYSTNVDVLEKLGAEGFTIADKVLEWRHLTKLTSTYTDSLQQEVNPNTNRVHTTFSPSLTATGRLSSSDPNLQNIPIRTENGKAIRKAFIAGEASKIVSCDYSQIELRLLAHMANIPTLQEAFNLSKDIHMITASHVLGIKAEEVTSEQRYQAKAINFGIIYGISAYGLARQLKILPSLAQKYIDAYFDRYPGIRKFMDDTVHFARENGYVKTIMGHLCHIKGINDKNFALRNYAERQAINAPLQGSNADIIKKAMIEIYALQKNNTVQAKMLLQVHDELIFEVPEEYVEKDTKIIKNLMQNVIKLKVPLVVNCGIGASWADAH